MRPDMHVFPVAQLALYQKRWLEELSRLYLLNNYITEEIISVVVRRIPLCTLIGFNPIIPL